MICSLFLCHGMVQQMPHSLRDSCRKNSLKKIKYFLFVEKGFLQGSLQKALLPMRKLGINEWIIQLVQETSLPTITCSKLTIETLEKGVKYVES